MSAIVADSSEFRQNSVLLPESFCGFPFGVVLKQSLPNFSFDQYIIDTNPMLCTFFIHKQKNAMHFELTYKNLLASSYMLYYTKPRYVSQSNTSTNYLVQSDDSNESLISLS